MMKLLTFKRDGKTYNVYGEYVLNIGEDVNIEELAEGRHVMFKYQYPEFSNVKMTVIVDGVEENFENCRTNFVGHRYNSVEELNLVLSSISHGSEVCQVVYIEDGLQARVEDCIVSSVELKGTWIRKRIWGNPISDIYQLTLATDKWLFYECSNGDMLMLDFNKKTVSADGAFAEMGFYDTLDRIRSNEEVLLYGKIPEENE